MNQQLQEHPSILPVDLQVTPSGELSLSDPPADDIFDPHFAAAQEFEDQRVPVAKLSHGSSTDTSVSPQVVFLKIFFVIFVRKCFCLEVEGFSFYFNLDVYLTEGLIH